MTLNHPEPEIASIIDRSTATTEAAAHYSDQTLMLRDMVNYGANLLARAYRSSGKELEDVVVLGVLLRQVTAMLDATEVLLVNGCSHAAYTTLRGALEASIYLDFVLYADSHKRAAHFIVWNYRRDHMWAMRAVRGSAERETFMKMLEGSDYTTGEKEADWSDVAEEQASEIRRYLSGNDFQAIDNAFTTYSRKNKRGDPEWYKLLDCPSVRAVAKQVGRLLEYVCYYQRASNVIHTATLKDHVISKKKNEVTVIPIRHSVETHHIILGAAVVGYKTFRSVLLRYRPGELGAFGNKYAGDWREPFMSNKKLDSYF